LPGQGDEYFTSVLHGIPISLIIEGKARVKRSIAAYTNCDKKRCREGFSYFGLCNGFETLHDMSPIAGKRVGEEESKTVLLKRRIS
jgi:hypothetical protein